MDKNQGPSPRNPVARREETLQEDRVVATRLGGVERAFDPSDIDPCQFSAVGANKLRQYRESMLCRQARGGEFISLSRRDGTVWAVWWLWGTSGNYRRLEPYYFFEAHDLDPQATGEELPTPDYVHVTVEER